MAGILVGGLLALGGLIALFVCLMNVAAGREVAGVLAGLVALGLGGAGADFIFRAVHGSTAVGAFRATVGLVFSVGVFGAVLFADLPWLTRGALLSLSVAGAWRALATLSPSGERAGVRGQSA